MKTYLNCLPTSDSPEISKAANWFAMSARCLAILLRGTRSIQSSSPRCTANSLQVHGTGTHIQGLQQPNPDDITSGIWSAQRVAQGCIGCLMLAFPAFCHPPVNKNGLALWMPRYISLALAPQVFSYHCCERDLALMCT